MKEKKFKFEQAVIQVVETKYVYKVEAKSYEQAERKLQEAFNKKAENGAEFKPIKKYLSKTVVVNEVPALPEELNKSTLTIDYIPGKKSEFSAKQLYNNADNKWDILQNTAEEGQEGEDSLL